MIAEQGVLSCVKSSNNMHSSLTRTSSGHYSRIGIIISNRDHNLATGPPMDYVYKLETH